MTSLTPRCVLIALTCAALWHFSLNGRAAERVALVIGNSKYEGEAALRNPANDADALEAALKELSFSVIKRKDLSLDQMQEAVLEFRRAQNKNGLGLFFYAGHGVQVKGENFLVPVGAKIREEFEVKRACLDVGYVLDAMTESEARLKVVILDSCRDNPYTRGWKSRSNSGGGLAAIADIPEGTVIAFSTSPGKTALDGRGANSPYAGKLVTALRGRPSGGLELREVFFTASEAVKRETGQAPWLNLDASMGRYFLWRGNVPNLVPAPAPSLALEGSQAGQMRSDNGLNMELVWCPAGSFTMGSPTTEEGRMDDEGPVAVTLSQGFWLGKYEVTQRHWQQVLGTTPWQGKEYVKEGSDYPARMPWGNTHGTKRMLGTSMKRMRIGWDRSWPTLGVCTTCTATCLNGAATCTSNCRGDGIPRA